MSVKDFYNAVTPGSHLTHGVGRGTYVILTEDDVHSARLYEEEKIPDKKLRVHAPSILNEVMNFILYQSKVMMTSEFKNT